MQKLTDPEVLANLLNRDWPWAGLAIGDLEPEWMGHCEWWQSANTIVLLFDRFSPRLMGHYGDASGLADILASLSEDRVWANVRLEFEDTFRRFYRSDRCARTRRMYLEQPVAIEGEAVRLSLADRPEIEELLTKGEWVLFVSECLASGHYYGVRENGSLIAIAGTHLASPRYNIAALGSVFTHSDHRGKGLARVCCTHTLASIGRAGIRRVVLNVDDRKASARRIYERLGFQTACLYLEGECVRI